MKFQIFSVESHIRGTAC